MYKLISIDFDGTLLTDDKKVLDSTYKTLNKAKDKYIIVGLTARTLESVKDVCNIDIFDYLVLNNGTSIYDFNNNKIEIISKINKDILVDIEDNIINKVTGIDYCSINNYYCTNTNHRIRSFIIDINSINDIKEDISRLNIYLAEDNLLDIQNYINNNYKELECIKMKDSNKEGTWLVVLPKNINKLTTIELLSHKLSIDLSQVVFFGDGLNDLEVINNVGLGVAVDNALPIIKEKAKDITLSNNDDGVGYYINNKLL